MTQPWSSSQTNLYSHRIKHSPHLAAKQKQNRHSHWYLHSFSIHSHIRSTFICIWSAFISFAVYVFMCYAEWVKKRHRNALPLSGKWVYAVCGMWLMRYVSNAFFFFIWRQMPSVPRINAYSPHLAAKQKQNGHSHWYLHSFSIHLR